MDSLGGGPLWRRVYRDLRDQLESGAIPAGRRLPSSRAYAIQAGISRKTVLEAYGQLVAEGFLESREGSGTYASASARAPIRRPAARLDAGPGPGFGELKPGFIDLRSGLPDLSLFPWDRWEKALRLARAREGAGLLGYGAPEGLPWLRGEIAAYLRRRRGFEADPDRIVVTSGTTQAIGLVGALFSSRGLSTAFLESPVARDIPPILADRGVRCSHVPVDAEGMRVEDLPRNLGGAFVVVSPSHQFPTGAVLSLARRRELIRRAEASGGYAVEDDYDSEFRHAGPPLATLASLSPDRVAFIGTFSKTLAPGLRLAFVHLPPEFIGAGRSAKWRLDLHSAGPEQGAMAAFLAEGWFEAHAAAMAKLYRRKRDAALAALALRSRRLAPSGADAGMHFIVSRRDGPVDEAFVRACAERRVVVYPTAIHAAPREEDGSSFIFGYGHLSEAEIEAAAAAVSMTADARPDRPAITERSPGRTPLPRRRA